MKPGNRILFTYEGRDLEGLVVKKKDGEVTIKLGSGYNIIAPEQELSIKKETAPKKKKAAKPKKEPAKKELPTIKILHTGGTIASKVDYETGAVVAKFSEQDLLKMFPELLDVANITSVLVGNMQSEMMRFAHWNILAEEVQKAIKEKACGVIITHGTDILHMTAAALAFALENCPIPVLLVGSQRSSDRPSSDAASNVLCAATFLAHQAKNRCGFTGVGVCLHEGVEKDDCVILSGTRCRKMHTSRRDAFKPINDSPLARISYPKLEVEKLGDYRKTDGKFVVRPFNEKLKIGILKMRPQMWAEEFKAYEKFDGLVIELLGIGHAPIVATDEHNKENDAIAKALAGLCKQMPIVAAPQTIFGRINMNVYSPGRQLIEMGVSGQGLDMTPETAYVKLAWLLSTCKDQKSIPRLYAENLRGEISARIEMDEYLE